MKNKLTAAYLHSDGHAILCYEQRVKIGGTYKEIEYVEIHEQWTKAPLQFQGRIVFHRYHAGAYLKFAKIAHVVTCSTPELDRGSENTKKRGLLYGSLDFSIEDGSCVSIPTFAEDPSWNDSYNSICSNGYTYQPNSKDTFESNSSGSTWCNHPIAKIHRVKREEHPVEACANRLGEMDCGPELDLARAAIAKAEGI